MTNNFPDNLFGQPVKPDDKPTPRYPIEFGDPADAYIVKRRISGEEVIEAAREVFGFEGEPYVILTQRMTVEFPGPKPASFLNDDPDVVWPAPSHVTEFNKHGMYYGLCRSVGRRLKWNWLYQKGRIVLRHHDLEFTGVRINLEEHELPDGFTITMGYDAETNTLAVLSEGE